ncbi:MAG: phosphatidylinositol-specific phospholipase C1-like protein [Halioglobus sp.]|nr:phosphatidylinositol-specific phospholipase C1-like protein [Halioglobus sp.]
MNKTDWKTKETALNNVPGVYALRRLLAVMAAGLALSACSDSSDSPMQVLTEPVRYNQLQFLGTHNSYHIEPRTDIFELLLAFIPDVAPTLQYSHVSLTEQFATQGIRQIELDVFHDPDGGLYADRKALSLFNEDPASGIAELDAPGLKVLHVQEIDYETTCFTFVSCLQEVKAWSDANPTHLPIMVLVEAKDDPIPDPLNLGFSVPEPFGRAALDLIDTEIRSVFDDARLILPDDVRGDDVTLELAVLTRGWPLISDLRGKIIFALDNGGDKRDLYVEGHTSLEGRVMFTDSPPGTPEAAFMKRNNPLSNPGEIEMLVQQGYLVRTRADADAEQARSGDTTQREAALNSGAHFISTDYPLPDPRFTDYQVQLPGGGEARCNPVNPGPCVQVAF